MFFVFSLVIGIAVTALNIFDIRQTWSILSSVQV